MRDRSRCGRRDPNRVTRRQSVFVLAGLTVQSSRAAHSILAFTIRHRVNRLSVGIAVVGPRFRGRRDRDRTVVHRDRQVGRDIVDKIVVRHIRLTILDDSSARNDLVSVRASLSSLTIQGDARQLVIVHKTRNGNLVGNIRSSCVGLVVLALRLTVVHVGLVFGRHSQGARHNRNRNRLNLFTTVIAGVCTVGNYIPSVGANSRFVRGDLVCSRIVSDVRVSTARRHRQVGVLVGDLNRINVLTISNLLCRVSHIQLWQRVHCHRNIKVTTIAHIAVLGLHRIGNRYRIRAVGAWSEGKGTIHGGFIAVTFRFTRNAAVILWCIPREHIGGSFRCGRAISVGWSNGERITRANSGRARQGMVVQRIFQLNVTSFLYRATIVIRHRNRVGSVSGKTGSCCSIQVLIMAPCIGVRWQATRNVSGELTVVVVTRCLHLLKGDGQVIGRNRHIHRRGAHITASVFDGNGTRIHQLLILLSNKSSSCRGLADKSNRTTNFSSGS